MKFSPEDNLKQAISPYDEYCVGFKTPGSGGGGYINAVILSIGKAPLAFSHEGSKILDSIVAYDKAEVNKAYIGQINMSIVSSFCGPNGLIWGYDIVKAPNLKRNHPLLGSFTVGDNVPVYTTESLEEMAVRLFGTRDEKRFNLLPGSHVPCAGRFLKIKGPAHIYCALGMGIPENRADSAILFMEDIGEMHSLDIEELRKKIVENMAQSIISIGNNHNIKYKEIFVGSKDQMIVEGEIGCNLVAIPYFTMAKKAIVGKMSQISLEEWENKVFK